MLTDSQRETLVAIGAMEIVRALLTKHSCDSLNDTLQGMVNGLRFDPTVYQYMRDYQEWVDNAPYTKLNFGPIMPTL
jgi:hypothetical protein